MDQTGTTLSAGTGKRPAPPDGGPARLRGDRTEALRGLSTIIALSIGARIALGLLSPAPFVFLDELGYAQMARSFAHGGHFTLYGKEGLAYSPLYPVLLSPVYALTSSATVAYECVKVLNAVLMSMSVVPVYGIARFVLSRRHSLLVAGLAALMPLMAYSSLELSENVAYPLCLTAVWAMLSTLKSPGRRNDLFLLGTILLACTARLQLVALIPAAITAIVLVALAQPTGGGRRVVVVRRVLHGHWLFFALVGAAVAAGAARTVLNGGTLPLAGRYSIVGSARPSPVHVFELVVNHLAGLDLAVGVLPFACALLASYGLVRSGFRRDALIFGAVALAVTAWFLIETGFDAAAYDKGISFAPSGQPHGDLPRIHERYLIYVIPFFLVALVSAVHLIRRRVPVWVHLSIACLAALLPALIPYSRVINHTIVADSPSLQLLANVTATGRVVPVTHPAATAVALAGVLAGVYLLSFMGRHRPLAMVVVVAVLSVLSLSYIARVGATASGSITLNLSSRGDWVDRAGPRSGVVLISGKGVRRVALLETAFFNGSISRLYYVCWSGFESDFGERQLELGANGELRDSGGSLRTRYAVAPRRLGIPGRVLATDKLSGLELIEPQNRELVVPLNKRRILGCGR